MSRVAAEGKLVTLMLPPPPPTLADKTDDEPARSSMPASCERTAMDAAEPRRRAPDPDCDCGGCC